MPTDHAFDHAGTCTACGLTRGQVATFGTACLPTRGQPEEELAALMVAAGAEPTTLSEFVRAHQPVTPAKALKGGAGKPLENARSGLTTPDGPPGTRPLTGGASLVSVPKDARPAGPPPTKHVLGPAAGRYTFVGLTAAELRSLVPGVKGPLPAVRLYLDPVGPPPAFRPHAFVFVKDGPGGWGGKVVCCRCGFVPDALHSPDAQGHCHCRHLPVMAHTTAAAFAAGHLKPHRFEFMVKGRPDRGVFCLNCGQPPHADRIACYPPTPDGTWAHDWGVSPMSAGGELFRAWLISRGFPPRQTWAVTTAEQAAGALAAGFKLYAVPGDETGTYTYPPVPPLPTRGQNPGPPVDEPTEPG